MFLRQFRFLIPAMKVLVVLLAVIGIALAASLPGPLNQTPNVLPSLPIERRGAQAETRIVGGRNVTMEEVPYTVAVLYTLQLYCGASLITLDKAVCAGHCTYILNNRGQYVDIPFTSLKIRAGSIYYGSGGQLVDLLKYVRHPAFNINYLNDDISLLYFKTQLASGSNVAPISLPEDEVEVGTLTQVTGWGATKENGNTNKYLQTVNVPIVSNEDCYNAYGGGINATMICAGVEKGGKDACQGDSGGPLVANNQLVGVVSTGYGCARAGYPGIYTNVYSYVDWINNTTSSFY